MKELTCPRYLKLVLKLRSPILGLLLTCPHSTGHSLLHLYVESQGPVLASPEIHNCAENPAGQCKVHVVMCPNSKCPDVLQFDSSEESESQLGIDKFKSMSESQFEIRAKQPF